MNTDALSPAPAASPNRQADEGLIRLTAAAAFKVRALMEREGKPHGVLRVAVMGGGCSGFTYKMEVQQAPAERDFVVETSGLRVVVDPKSAPFLTGTELDFALALTGGGFKFRNPNAANSCSCGESFCS